MTYQFLHAADIHLGHRQYNRTERERDMYATFKRTLEDAVNDHGIDAVFIPGDLFHSRDLRPSVLETAERALDVVPEDVPVLVTPGNHDQNLDRREMTWLEYLHQRDAITLLQPDFAGISQNERSAEKLFPSPQAASEGEGTGVDGTVPGYFDLEVSGFDAPLRVFGLEYRGGYIDTALEQTKTAIKSVNDRAGEPSHTVLMGHFGVADEVPDLGAAARYSTLQQLEDVVDYLALGHIHKPYEGPGDDPWFFNPGSLEAHSTDEARWELGYYVTELGAEDFAANHQTSKRRPFYTFEWDVDGYDTWSDLVNEFGEAVDSKRADIETWCSRDEYTTKDGDPRSPVIDLQIQGHLEFDRRDLDVEALESMITEVTNAVHVQTKTSVTTAEIIDLVEDMDEEAVFTDTGTLRTEILEDEVFTTVAEQTPFSEDPEATAEALTHAKELVIEEQASGESVADYLQERRRETFQGGVGSVDPTYHEVADHADDGGIDDEVFNAVHAGEEVDPVEAAAQTVEAKSEETSTVGEVPEDVDDDASVATKGGEN